MDDHVPAPARRPCVAAPIHLLFLSLVLALAPPLYAADRSRTLALEGGLSGSRRLVLVLHGGSWDGTPSADLARRALNALSSDARRVGLRLLVPILPDPSPSGPPLATPAGAPPRVHDPTVPWAGPDGERRVLAVLEGELVRGRCDADRVALAGHGSGATAALLLAARHPERFSALALWSGAPTPVWDEQRRVVGLAEDPVPRLAGRPLYLWTGDDDPIVDRAAVRRLVDGLTRAAREGAGPAPRHETGPGGHGWGGRAGPAPGLRFLKRVLKRGRAAPVSGS